MNFKNEIRYREKLQTVWKSLMQRTNTTSYRTKKHYNVSRANIGLIVHVCHKMSTPEVKYEMQPRNSQNSSFKLRSLTESPARTSIKRAQ